MCGVAYTPYEATNKTKIHGVEASGEVPPTGGRVVQRWGTRGDPNVEESEVVTELCRDTGVLGF